MSQAPHPASLPSLPTLLGKECLATLPTPVRDFPLRLQAITHTISVKLDNLAGDLYGGNKVRKLEYILYRARQRRCERIATFGTVGSHHALATALYSQFLGYPCICFLSHQRATPETAAALRMHLQLGTSVVRFGGSYEKRLRVLRENLWGLHPWVVPAGGTNWLGAFAFVCAGIELARQVEDGLIPPPDRLYVAAGTMGTAAGLALGLALSQLPTEVHAVRVSAPFLCNEDALRRLIDKTACMMNSLDRSVPRSIADRVNIRLRHEFFAGGYAHSDSRTEQAIEFARDEMGLQLERTYTGKAMAALLHDLSGHAAGGQRFLFWNTYNSAVLPLDGDKRPEREVLPAEFQAYLEG